MKQLTLALIAVMLLVPQLSHAFEAGFARISMIEGEALIKTEEGTEWLPASINTPLYEGDSIWSPEGSRVEIQLQNNSYLRLDGSSSLDLVVMDRNFQQCHLAMGHAYVRTATGSDNGLQIDVNDTAVKVYDKARFRIDIGEDGDEEISVFKGNAYIEGEGGKTRLRTGEMIAVEGSRSELAPLGSPDEWERWNRDRDRRVAGRNKGSRYLPEELNVYSEDLDANGEWVRSAQYGYVWRPTAVVGAEWSPYQVGRWVWRGGDYIWVSYETWGWAPYHYGRWVVLADRGWCWVPPDRTDIFWGPGYVGWVTTPSYVGWVPLAPGEVYYGRGYYGRHSVNIINRNVTTINQTNITNITTVNNVSYKNVTVNNAVTVVKRDSFAAGRVERVKVRENVFAQRNAAIGAPAVKPVAKEAMMPVLKTVAPAKLPPARLVSVPARELRERHPRLMDRPTAAPLVNEKGRPGREQRKPQEERTLPGPQKPAEMGKVERPRSEVPVQQRLHPADQQTREPEQRRGGAGQAPIQQETQTPKLNNSARSAEQGRPGLVRPEPKAVRRQEGRPKKVWKVKQQENEPQKEKQK